jgi:hypothetical protein
VNKALRTAVATKFSSTTDSSSAQALKDLYAMFANGMDAVPIKELDRLGIAWPTLHRILRQVPRARGLVMAPATPAMGIVLRYQLDEVPPIDELARLLAQSTAASPCPGREAIPLA